MSPRVSSHGVTRSDMNTWSMWLTVVVFPHTRGCGTEASCRWSDEKHSIGRDGEDDISGVSGEGGFASVTGDQQGGTLNPSWCGSECHCAPWLPLHEANRISAWSTPAPHRALGCPSSVSSDLRLWGTLRSSGNKDHTFYTFCIKFFHFDSNRWKGIVKPEYFVS